MKYTEGPWFYEEDTQTIRHGEHDGKLNPNSKEVSFDGSGEGEANCRLAATAPELLKIAMAYRNLLRTAARTEGGVATFHHIESVIKKAKGEE